MAIRLTEIENGKVMGIPAGNNNFTVFKSIPYASPPIGNNRWKKPQPAENWKGIYVADKFKAIAAQEEENHPFYAKEFYRYREEMNEDCLYLSIWTPAASIEDNLPVLVFYHGGAFRSGYHYEITIDGEAFCKQDIIVVSVDYRLGALGYLAHPELTLENDGIGSGNWGLHDQIAALKWIKRNIKAFGGDPHRITISGQSAGALSVQNMLTSPLIEEGDISGAIMQSGGGLDSAETQVISCLSLEEAEKKGQQFFKSLGVNSISEARELDWKTIVAAQEKAGSLENGIMFAPIVDNITLTMQTYESIRSGNQLNIPIIIGTTADESGASKYEKIEPAQFEKNCINKYGVVFAKEFLEICGYDKNPIEAARHGTLNDGLQPAVLAWCEYQTRVKRNKPTWLYYFTRELPGEMPAGAYHSAELWYVFGTIHRCYRPLVGVDYDLANTINNYWSNFVKTGNPNGDNIKKWDNYSADCRSAMEFGDRVGMLDYPGSARSRYLADYILDKS